MDTIFYVLASFVIGSVLLSEVILYAFRRIFVTTEKDLAKILNKRV